ncbi:hypothetical protein BJY01DRAFT_253908 [Aspergillus pseudoustus]|uniref:Uncharacterized protein n=1 Tax=Aspergillus pseudoustus TaxID=1810923 RepID=A0ABR4IWZ4_9EURO
MSAFLLTDRPLASGTRKDCDLHADGGEFQFDIRGTSFTSTCGLIAPFLVNLLIPSITPTPTNLAYENPTLAMSNPADFPPGLFTLTVNGTDSCCPGIYTKWTYDGAQHTFHFLWSFWLTVNRNPEITGLVETLVIGNWGFNEYETLGHEFDDNLKTSDLDLVRAKIRTVGLQEETILEDLAHGGCQPIMALLLTCLPNATAIDAHVPRSDPVWGSVLRRILAQRQRASATDRTTSDRAPIPFRHLTSVRSVV